MNEHHGNNDDQQGRATAGFMPGANLGFLALVFLMGMTGYLLYSGVAATGIAAFIFILSGWLIALCLHEFGHALTAYCGGDHQIAETGYLRLDPLAYTHPVYSLLLPSLFIALGFFALPGGVVYVRSSALRSRYWECAVSAAGPLMTFFCLCVICMPFSLAWYDGNGTPEFWGALAMLTCFLALALVWNLLPVPGLDGWGIIEPYLGRDVQNAALPWRRVGPLLLVFAVVVVPPLGGFVFRAASDLALLFDVPGHFIVVGWRLFTSWR